MKLWAAFVGVIAARATPEDHAPESGRSAEVREGLARDVAPDGISVELLERHALHRPE